MAEYNRHKLVIIKSMAYLAGSGKNQTQRDLVFNTLTKILVDFGNVGIVNQDNDFKNSSTYIDIIEKIYKVHSEKS